MGGPTPTLASDRGSDGPVHVVTEGLLDRLLVQGSLVERSLVEPVRFGRHRAYAGFRPCRITL